MSLDLKKDVPAYDNLIKALRNAGYFIYHVTNKDYLSFAIPSTFLDKNSNLLDLLMATILMFT
ncbi:MAG: hypothetical protein HWD58_19825 [Bacteroidota bacterium]|nr:MAG: hypothetical protein HWD58_19825 [Bacteroidota bacterium]